MTEESGIYVEDHEIILARYNRLYHQYGEDDVRSLSWGSDNSQQERFRVLAETADLEGCSILDVGSGFGDLYRFLKEKVKDLQYTGYDLNANMVKAARRKTPGVRFVCCDILESSKVEAYDYVLSSGIHNLKLADNERTWKTLVRRMFEVCRKGVGTNFLSCYTDGTMAGDSYYAQPQAVFSYCMTLTKRVVLRHDYRTNDFTVYLYK